MTSWGHCIVDRGPCKDIKDGRTLTLPASFSTCPLYHFSYQHTILAFMLDF